MEKERLKMKSEKDERVFIAQNLPYPTYNLLLFALSRNRKVLHESVNRSHQLVISWQNRKDFTLTYIINNEQLA